MLIVNTICLSQSHLISFIRAISFALCLMEKTYLYPTIEEQAPMFYSFLMLLSLL